MDSKRYPAPIRRKMKRHRRKLRRVFKAYNRIGSRGPAGRRFYRVIEWGWNYWNAAERQVISGILAADNCEETNRDS